MHIEVFQGSSSTDYNRPSWYWHFKNGNKIVADAEEFPSKANAMRAAKAVVRATIKEYFGYMPMIEFRSAKTPAGCYKVTWFAK